MTSFLRQCTVGAALLALSTAVLAHTGHDISSFTAGLDHPLGADHLLAMVAVGLWSVFALPAGRAWMGPATFMLALVLSAALGAGGFSLPFLEHAISLSVVVFGVMLVLATRGLPAAKGLSLIAIAASLHGLAHGAEAPAAESFAGYAAGFLITTAVLHFGGVFGGTALRRSAAAMAPRILSVLGAAFSVAGAYLFTQL